MSSYIPEKGALTKLLQTVDVKIETPATPIGPAAPSTQVVAQTKDAITKLKEVMEGSGVSRLPPRVAAISQGWFPSDAIGKNLQIPNTQGAERVFLDSLSFMAEFSPDLTATVDDVTQNAIIDVIVFLGKKVLTTGDQTVNRVGVKRYFFFSNGTSIVNIIPLDFTLPSVPVEVPRDPDSLFYLTYEMYQTNCTIANLGFMYITAHFQIQ